MELDRRGMSVEPDVINRYLMHAEAEGIVCSGVDKGKKYTYALLDERVAPTKELSREEALVKLALNYFRSHSPASIQDFLWWSGLSVSEGRKAVGGIENELVKEDRDLLVHESCLTRKNDRETLHFLPAFDEYLISYKDRTAVLEREYFSGAFNNWGIFYPVVAYNGTIIGNWTKTVKRKEFVLLPSIFEKYPNTEERLLKLAENKYRAFYTLNT